MSSEESRDPQGLEARHSCKALAARLEAGPFPKSLWGSFLPCSCSLLTAYCSLLTAKSFLIARVSPPIIKVTLTGCTSTRAARDFGPFLFSDILSRKENHVVAATCFSFPSLNVLLQESAKLVELFRRYGALWQNIEACGRCVKQNLVLTFD